MAIEYSNFFIPRPSKIYQNSDFWFEKTYHLATLSARRKLFCRRKKLFEKLVSGGQYCRQIFSKEKIQNHNIGPLVLEPCFLSLAGGEGEDEAVPAPSSPSVRDRSPALDQEVLPPHRQPQQPRLQGLQGGRQEAPQRPVQGKTTLVPELAKPDLSLLVCARCKNGE
jgi:hypothetical protein